MVLDVLEGKAGEISLMNLDEDFRQRNSNVRMEFYFFTWDPVQQRGYISPRREIIFSMDAERSLEWIQKHNWEQYPIQTLAEYYADCAALEGTKK